jgi:uncharacterized protein YecE (DUF72 family)
LRSRGRSLPAVRVGTSGWIYRHWRGLLYPRQLDGRTELDYYAERFDTVELNNSFYRLPAREVFESWHDRAPMGFLFAVKASRYLTHMKRLRESEEPLQRLMDRAAGLGEKLGPILFQLPPNFEADLERLRQFVAALERYRGQPFTFEFRHPSWLVPEVYQLLEAAGVALCLPVGMKLPVEVRLTADWSYIRMHRGRFGIGFSDRELETWAGHINDFRRQGAEVYVYFNNDTGGHALRDAARLRAMLQG